ncbi:succinate dehydrogenase cytochrome b560 subunit [Myriangium duriaei CBS 260.36]|uniref:Succinate dehydrogenase cytochrome b560 subunit n=1 Tax=Myriangium duriaei CBS 260.36 TaxID=1168546 RepID=A0A9P4MKR8_9PEZI|nr:succinate dehydrogenase cytochrome b560 subunit [Myriangium duriaei CBS 260.36]
MLAQRMMQQSARRLAAQPAAGLFAARTPYAIIASQATSNQRRCIETAKLSSAEATDAILAKQRLNRPVAPHLGIYRPQITWYLSMFNRLTGIAMSGPFYLFGLAYLAAPLTGWHLESATLAASFAAWPAAAQVATKFIAALPFTFHSFNGLRHLVWDAGSMINNKQVWVTGWSVVGLTFVSSLALALY